MPVKNAPNVGVQDINEWERRQDPGYVSVADEDEGERIVEVPPRVGAPKLSEKARAMVERARKATPAKSVSARPIVSRAKTTRARVSVEKLIGGAWRMLAQAIQPINLPVARVLDVQAPVAGMVLEDIVKNTVVDRVLQPLARVGEGGEVAFALMGPPVLVGLLTAKPDMAPVLVPMLRAALRTWIDVAGPKLEEIQKKDDEFESKYGARIDDMISYFLGDGEGDKAGG
jgi:hypothetical protein